MRPRWLRQMREYYKARGKSVEGSVFAEQQAISSEELFDRAIAELGQSIGENLESLLLGLEEPEDLDPNSLRPIIDWLQRNFRGVRLTDSDFRNTQEIIDEFEDLL